MISIISSQRDEHARAVMRLLTDMGADHHLLDLSEFPQFCRLDFEYSTHEQNRFFLEYGDGRRIDLSDCGAVWWRRPQPFSPHPEIETEAHRRFVATESYEAFKGMWLSLDPFWVNPPLKDEAAHRKGYQLATARRLGFEIPETLITNCPSRAAEFIGVRGCERTVYKAFSATEQDWRETRILRENELALLDRVKYAPLIFQEYIPAQYDIRLTVIGDQLFPAAVHSQQTDYKVDMRMDFARATVEATTIPEELASAIRALMRELGLQYGAIDMRLTPEGEYVFLEVNPVGQWIFVEERTGQQMSRAMATLLYEKDRSRAS